MDLDSEILRYGRETGSRVFRVSMRRFEPMSTPPRSMQGLGRFDDPSINADDDAEGYAILYCAEEPESAFIETLSRFRPRLQELAEIGRQVIIDVQQREDLLGVAGHITANWYRDWCLTSADVVTRALVLDLADPAAVQFVREALAPSIIALGLDDLDFGDVLGSDRRLTRAISRWVWSMSADGDRPHFSGIRYRSRFDPDATCLALYEGRYEVVGDPEVHSIMLETPGFADAAKAFRLVIE